MSWREAAAAAAGRRRCLRLAAAGSVAALAAACGFRPLYGRRESDGSATVDDLAEIYIAPVPDRPGQQFTNLLRDRINPRGVPARARYRLEVILTESITEVALRRDETATRANLRMTANYVLVSRVDDSVVLRGRSFSVNSYNILESQFATQVSADDARERGIRELTDDIRTRLAVYFSRAGGLVEG